MSGRSPRGLRGESASVAWDPMRELTGLKERLNHLFESALRRGGAAEAGEFAGWSPAVDLREDRDAFVLYAEIPGVPRTAIQVRLEGRTLTLEGDRPLSRSSRQADHQRIERSYGPFTRAFQLPAAVDETGVVAEFERGILRIRLPKTTRERSAPVRIRVR
jgi:HSP20 family protein